MFRKLHPVLLSSVVRDQTNNDDHLQIMTLVLALDRSKAASIIMRSSNYVSYDDYDPYDFSRNPGNQA